MRCAAFLGHEAVMNEPSASVSSRPAPAVAADLGDRELETIGRYRRAVDYLAAARESR
jgi:hypothetical protein